MPTVTRRSMLEGSLWAAGGLAVGAVQAAEPALSAAGPIVRIKNGRLRGVEDDGVQVFKGLPYAAAPVGENRFRPPQRPAAGSGVRDALQYGPMALQKPAIGSAHYLQVLDGLYPPRPYRMSEDCLYLNLWSKELGRHSPRPVMVWLHPGGFNVGAGHSPWTDGAYLARERDVVVVSLNHRLNLFGHLYLGEIGGARYAESGNVALLDIVAALTWVQENIAHFGGDPHNVTLFGESGGGGKVCALMAVPAAQGLFHKAIVQSGSFCRALPATDAAHTTTRVLTALNVDPAALDALQHMSSEKLLEVALDNEFSPVVTGATLPRHPCDPDAPAVSAAVPVLIGTTRDDAVYFSLDDPAAFVLTEPELHTRVKSLGFDEAKADALIAGYRATRPAASFSDLYFALATEVLFRRRALTHAELKSQQGVAPAYLYVFDWRSPAFGGQYRACHTFDIPFVFGNIDRAPQLWGPEPDSRRYDLAATMSRAWAAFAHNGNPNYPGLPPWRPYTTAGRATMIFNYTCEAVNDPGRADRLSLTAALNPDP